MIFFKEEKFSIYCKIYCNEIENRKKKEDFFTYFWNKKQLHRVKTKI